jgi:CRP-like cAMP-binding protein
MFTDAESNCNVEVPPKPKYVLLDLSIVTGIDTSAVDIMVEISSLCKSNSCHLLLSGIPPSVKPSLIAGGLTPSRLNHPHLSFMDDLDTSLGKAEDDLLRLVAHNEERIIKDGKKQKHQRITSMIDNGLRYALRKIDEQHGLGFASHLADLEKYAVSRELEPGELLNEEGSEYLQRGLYFIESGLIKCSVDASASLTRGRQGVGGIRRNDTSIGQMNARSGTLAKNAAIIKNCSRSSFIQFDNNIRLGRFGPGWVLGTISEFTGQDIPGTYSCITPCRVHHLAFEAIEELEIEKPLLILNLYKMLAHIMARRQEMTIGQLSTFRTIMSSNFQARPPSRRSIIAVNKAIQSSV